MIDLQPIGTIKSCIRFERARNEGARLEIKLLERASNAALVHRTTRCISVTEAGERFYLQCVDILARIERAVEGAGGERQLQGQLRISAPPSFSTAVIAPHLQEFLKNHPELPSIYKFAARSPISFASVSTPPS